MGEMYHVSHPACLTLTLALTLTLTLALKPNPDPNPDHKPEPKPGITNYINWRARIFGGWTKNELKIIFFV